MFSGIIADVGRIVAINESADWRITIASQLRAQQCKLGASIACNGCCLTVAGLELANAKKNEAIKNEAIKNTPLEFTVQAGATTRERTTVASWRAGMRVNLEGALSLGDALDGHLVMGHVDGRVRLARREERENELLLHFELAKAGLPADEAKEEDWSNMLVARGSVALDGVSLTVASTHRENIASSFSFAVAIIPYTAEHTTLGELRTGDWANIELDMLARYVAARTNFDKKS